MVNNKITVLIFIFVIIYQISSFEHNRIDHFIKHEKYHFQPMNKMKTIEDRIAENVRHKRFWLFAKNDDNSRQVHPYSYKKSHGSSIEGLWRSGVVGRRR